MRCGAGLQPASQRQVANLPHIRDPPMTAEPYLAHLTARLADGLARVPEPRRQRHVRYLLLLQNPDGGFPGREGGSDLYYTGFALRGLAVLDALTPDVSARAAAFLRGSLQQQTSVIDF